jgi:hypothetical protein
VLLCGFIAAPLLPATLWYCAKPLRILAPQADGMICRAAVCVEDPAQMRRAQRLQREAMAAVDHKLVAIKSPPLTIFCSTRKCYRSFGGGAERGATLFDLGVILPPGSWVPYIVEHEYIHMLQAQELGLMGRCLRPDWYIEGMAFSVSDPPAWDLPAYARPLVARYVAWERRTGRENVWREARRLNRFDP